MFYHQLSLVYSHSLQIRKKPHVSSNSNSSNNNNNNNNGISLQLATAPPLSFFYEVVLHAIHSVLNKSVRVSGGHHYLPRKKSLKLC